MEIVEAVLGILNQLWDPIARGAGYVRNLRRNIEKLKFEAGDLFSKREDVRQKISSDTVNKMATNECTNWLKNADETQDQVNIILKNYEDDKKCIAGWCPNVYFRMKLGKRVQNIIESIANLKENLSTFKDRELVDALPETIEPQFAPKIEANTSTDCTLQKILECIRDAQIQKIGIWGMGGVGKTTVMKSLNGQLEISHMFEIVIWVTVSKEGNRRTVQNEIAGRLNLAVSNELDSRIHAKICQSLRKKKFLLLLDDVWKRIDLSDVGIPDLNQENGCKVVLTTRSLSICNQMETDKEIKVDTLTDEEAWSLFHEKVGDVVMSHGIEPYARSVVKECDGLPLAIIAVGSALKRKDDVTVWKSALNELQSPATSQIEPMEEQVFRCLRFSYDQLQDDCKRKLFLYCAMYPEDNDIGISELAEYCRIEGFLNGVGSIAKARDKGHRLVIDLIDASLLEKSYNMKQAVKMHDVVRDLALRITSIKGEGSRFSVRAGKRAVDPLEETEWEQSEKISLMRSKLDSLPERPNCPILSTLFLQYTDLAIPDSFFEHMPILHLLVLSGTPMKSLPSSLWNLINLRGLYLRDCGKLEELSSQVGELMVLEVLDLGGDTEIKYLPTEVGQLTRLKRLIVAFKQFAIDEEGSEEWNMKLRIPGGIISRLPLLEELSMFAYEGILNEKQQWDDESMEVVVDELCGSKHLTCIEFYFPKVECLQQFLQRSRPWKAGRLTKFQFRLGSCKAAYGGNLFTRYSFEKVEEEEGLLIKKGGDDGISHVSIGEALGRCSEFWLEGDDNVRKLSEVGMENMNELKKCTIVNCDKMETLLNIDDGDDEARALLPNLVELTIFALPNWSSLWVGPLPHGSLSRLRHLWLDGCINLKKAFSYSIIRQLSSLEILVVDSCSSLEEIIGVDEEEEEEEEGMSSVHHDRVILPNLKYIWLQNLPELVSICRGGGVSWEWPSLEQIVITDCPKVKTLSFITHSSNAAPNLKMIKGQNKWWEALEWEDNAIKQRLQPTFRAFRQ